MPASPWDRLKFQRLIVMMNGMVLESNMVRDRVLSRWYLELFR